MTVIKCAYNTKEQAKKVGEIILNKNLTCYCQIETATELIKWQGRVVEAEQFILEVHAPSATLKEIEDILIENNDDDIPEIIGLSAMTVEAYENWLKSVLDERFKQDFIEGDKL